jgi:hypothetical protein
MAHLPNPVKYFRLVAHGDAISFRQARQLDLAISEARAAAAEFKKADTWGSRRLIRAGGS